MGGKYFFYFCYLNTKLFPIQAGGKGIDSKQNFGPPPFLCTNRRGGGPLNHRNESTKLRQNVQQQKNPSQETRCDPCHSRHFYCGFKGASCKNSSSCQLLVSRTELLVEYEEGGIEIKSTLSSRMVGCKFESQRQRTTYKKKKAHTIK